MFSKELALRTPLTVRLFLHRPNDMDAAMKKARALFEKSGKSLEELGKEMGYTGDTRRKAAWQFLNMTADPRLSMLRKFCKAMGVTPKDLF